MRVLVPIIVWTFFLGCFVLGLVLAPISFFAGFEENARNAALIPVALLPAIVFLLWIKKGRGRTLTQTQNIAAGYWIVPFSAGASYLATFLPDRILIAALSSTIINIILWILLVQITRRLYRIKRQSNIAKASGRPINDPDVRNLSNNTDLATATVIATFTTAKSVILMESEIGPYFFREAIVVIGMNIGAILGFLYFNLSPKQSDIRELISTKCKEEKEQED